MLILSCIGVHTKNSMMNMQDTVSQLESFLVESSFYTEFDFARNYVIISKNKHGNEGSRECTYVYALATMALSSKLGVAKAVIL